MIYRDPKSIVFFLNFKKATLLKVNFVNSFLTAPALLPVYFIRFLEVLTENNCTFTVIVNLVFITYSTNMANLNLIYLFQLLP